MKVLFVFNVSFFSISAIADSLPYDSNCVELGKKWKWIDKFDSTDPHKRSYAKNSEIQKNFSQIEKKVVEQLDLWKDVEKYVPCLGDKAGLHFVNEKLVITDMKTFRDFRLLGSKIDCTVTRQDLHLKRTWNDKDDAYMTQRRLEAVDTTSTSAFKNSRAITLNEESKIEFLKNEALANELREKMRHNNNLGDLGMENYCSHQLRTGIVRDEATRLEKDFQTCSKASKTVKATVLNSNICQGYPEKNLADIKALEKVMKDILEDQKSKGWQPLITVNAADNDVYGPLKNDYEKLHKAKLAAAKNVKFAHDSEKFLADNQMTKDIDSIKACAPEENVLTDQFLEGSQCTISDNPLAKLVDEFKFSIKALKDTHQAALIDAVNVRSYGEAIKSKYYLLEQNDPLKGVMYNDPQKACMQMISKDAQSYACKGPYLEAFKKAAAEASSKDQKPHFLSYPPQKTVSAFNSGIENLHKLCGFLTSYITDAQRAQVKKDLDKQLEYIQTYFGPYLYNENLKNKAHLGDYKNESNEYCPKFNPDKKRGIELYNVVDARKEFLDATDAQIKTSADFSTPDKGGRSNKLGAWSCEEDKGAISNVTGVANAVVNPVGQLAVTSLDVGRVSDAQMKEKNNLYALSSLYHSHPYMVGKMLAKLPLSERKIYTSLICDAKKCNKKVEDTNKAIDTAAQVAVIALNAVPVVGQVATAALAAVTVVGESVLVINNNAKATEDYNAVVGGMVSGGLSESAYDSRLQKMIEGLKENSGNEALAKELFQLLPELAFGPELEALKITTDAATAAAEIASKIPKGEMNVAVLKEIIKFTAPAIAQQARKIANSETTKKVIGKAQDHVIDAAESDDLIEAVSGPIMEQLSKSTKLKKEVREAMVKSANAVRKSYSEPADSSDKDKK